MNADKALIQHIGRLTPLAEVLAMIAHCAPVEGREVATPEARGLVLAADVVSPRALPEAPTALRDGWALHAEATRDAGPYAPMPLDPPPLRIDAFAPMPPGTDAVAPPDAVALAGGALQITAPVAPGEGVLPKSGDAPRNGVLLAAGTRLRTSDIAVLMAAGITKLQVRSPRLRLVMTKPGVLAPAAQFVARAAEAAGAEITVEPDGNLETAFRAGADAVIGLGGTGSGSNDRSVIALSRSGELQCHGVGLAPGDTAAFGHVEGRPVLLLPGRIDAAIAAWLVLGRVLLAHLAGSKARDAIQPVKLARKVTSTVGIAEFVPLLLSEDGAVPLASGFVSLQHLTQANGWMLVPAESEGYAADTIVPMSALP